MYGPDRRRNATVIIKGGGMVRKDLCYQQYANMIFKLKFFASLPKP